MKLESVKSFDEMKSICRENQLGYVKYCNLFNNNLKEMNFLEEFTNLQTLVLSFNEIKVISGLDQLTQLTRLDLNHNFISKIEALDSLKSLKSLNIANNWISDFNDIEYLASTTTSLEELHLKCNPISSNKNFRAQIFRTMSFLARLDGVPKTPRDTL